MKHYLSMYGIQAEGTLRFLLDVAISEGATEHILKAINGHPVIILRKDGETVGTIHDPEFYEFCN